MTRMVIELTDAQQSALDSLARDSGRTQEEIMRDALDRILDETDAVDWRSALARLEGIWADRDDLPDLRELRREWDRNLSPEE